MMAHKKRASTQLAPTLTPTRRLGGCDLIIQKRGGTGTRRQASPDPHTTHIPKLKVQGVCR
jgi:hypothetical protein